MATTASAAEPDRVDAPVARRVVPILNPANAVTASRFLTLPFLWWAVDRGAAAAATGGAAAAAPYHQWATLFIFTCAVLDKVDGLVARVFDCKSPFGELFDAIADGICFGFGLIVVTAYGWAPLGSVSVIVSLGVLNTVLRFVYMKRAGRATNYKSYAMERVVAFTAFQIGFATSGMEVPFFYWTFAPVMIVTVLYDAKRMLLDPIAPILPIPGAKPVPGGKP